MSGDRRFMYVRASAVSDFRPVTSIAISGTTSVAVGGTTTLTAAVSPAGASDRTVTWQSSNSTVATVSASGVVTGKAAGTTTITATARDGSGKSASVQVRVGPLDNTLMNVQLPETGTGYKTYEIPARRFGTEKMIHTLQEIGRQWDAKGWGPIGIGCIGLNGGGVCHTAHGRSHQAGKDVDIRPIRTDGTGDSVTIFQNAYSRERTRELIKIILAAGDVRLIYFNDEVLINEFSKVEPYADHNDHLHVSFN